MRFCTQEQKKAGKEEEGEEEKEDGEKDESFVFEAVCG